MGWWACAYATAGVHAGQKEPGALSCQMWGLGSDLQPSGRTGHAYTTGCVASTEPVHVFLCCTWFEYVKLWSIFKQINACLKSGF